MRGAFATLAVFTLFTCTAAQSPIVTTSTSRTLSDDMQDDDLSDISEPEDFDPSTSFDDSSQVSAGSETSENGIQSDITDDYGSPVSPTPIDSSTAGEVEPTAPGSSATNPASPSPVSAADSTPDPVAPTTSPAPTATTLVPSTAAPAEEHIAPTTDDDTATDDEPTPALVVTPTPAAADLPTTTPSPSITPTESPNAETVNSTNGVAGLWVDSRIIVSTVAVGALGVIALRFGVFAGEL